jgi:hypothetical protein
MASNALHSVAMQALSVAAQAQLPAAAQRCMLQLVRAACCTVRAACCTVYYSGCTLSDAGRVTGGARESERRERRRERVGRLCVERHHQLRRIEVARRRNMARRVATWCAALQHGAPRCNSVALRSAELTRLGGCKLRHVAFACGYIAPWCNIPCCTMTHAVAQHIKAAWWRQTSAPAAVRRSLRGACASRRARRCVETEPCGRHTIYSALNKHSMLRRVATAMPTAAIRPAPMPGESRAGRVLDARICILA